MRQASAWGCCVTPAERAGRRAVRDVAGRIVIPEYRKGHAIWFIGRLVEDGPDARRAGGDAEPPKYFGLPGPRPLLGYERVR